MKKHYFVLAAVLMMSQFALAAPKIQQVEPLSWWTNMNMPLTLMFHGQDLQDAQVSVQQIANGKVMRGECLGLVPRGQHNAESPNYLFVDFGVFQPAARKRPMTMSSTNVRQVAVSVRVSTLRMSFT